MLCAKLTIGQISSVALCRSAELGGRTGFCLARMNPRKKRKIT